MKNLVPIIRLGLLLLALATTALSIAPRPAASQDTTCCFNELGCLGGRYACGICNGFHCTTSIR